MAVPILNATWADYKRLLWILPAIIIPGIVFVALAFYFLEVNPPGDEKPAQTDSRPRDR